MSLHRPVPSLSPSSWHPLDWHTVADQVAGWFEAHALQIVVALGAGVAFYLLFNLLRGWGVRLCQRGQGFANWYAILGRAIGRTGQLFMALAAARLVVGYANAPEWLTQTTTMLFTVVAVFQGAIWLREIVFGVIEHRTLDSEHRGQALISALSIIRLLVSIALFAVAIVVVLGNLGVNVAGLVAGLGVGGIAVGLAAQDVFADLFAALAILFDRPFRVGDAISYDKGASSGTVEAIGLKSTRIRGSGGEERIIANKKLLDFEILNTTRRLHNRFKFEFFLGFGSDPATVRRVPGLLRAAVESEGHTLVHGGVNGFAANGLSYDVEFESTGIDFPADARDRVAAAILACLRDHDISFAYPTQVTLTAEKTKPSPPAVPHED
ncbi:MAG: mechanosensitive ion channel family protein [Proteobacteria bacterium]|nr:mechanosensitive ion channel family protein [Pseudomonadota bacterium]